MLVGLHVEHLKRRGLAEGTIGKRRRRLLRFDEQVGLEVAAPEDVEAFLDKRNLSAKTRYDWVSDLHNFYRWANDWGHLVHDPTLRVARPKLRRNLPRPIQTGDLAMALQMAEPTMRAWLALAAFGGLRCAEIAGLEVGSSFLWDDGLIRVVGKGDKERLVPIHSQVRRTMAPIPLPSRGRIFRRPRGGAYPASVVSREISLYLHSLGINATAHQLRHWFGTNTYRACHDLRVVQELMGHASPTTTSIYADWSRPEARRVIDALELDSATEATLFTDWPAAGG